MATRSSNRGNIFFRRFPCHSTGIGILLIFLPRLLFAQEPPRISEKVDYPIGYVYEIKQDDLSFNWIASQSGLFCFDGSQVRHFPDTSKTERLIRFNELTAMAVDTIQKRVWVGNERGLGYYSTKDETFHSPTHYPRSWVRVIYRDNDNNVFAFSDDEGLQVYQPEQDSFVRANLSVPEDSMHRGIEKVNDLIQDRQNKNLYWLGTLNGLLRWNRSTGAAEAYFPEGMQGKDPAYVDKQFAIKRVTIGPGGDIYTIGWQGAFRFWKKAEKLEVLADAQMVPFHKQTRYWSGDYLQFIPDGRALISYSKNSGLAIYDPVSHRFQAYYPYNKYRGTGIFKADQDGRLWSFGGGIKWYNPVQNQMKRFRIINPDTVPCSYDFSRLHWNDSLRQLVCPVHLGDGIHSFDARTGKWQVSPLSQSAFEKKYRKYSCLDILHSKVHKTLVLTKYVILQKTENGDFRKFPYQPKNTEGTYASLLEDDQNNLWLGTYGGELFRISPKGELENLSHKLLFADDDSAGWVNAIHKDQNGRIWIRRHQGMAIYLPEEQRFLLHSFKQNGVSLGHGESFITDHENRTWVTGLHDGLGMTDPQHPEKGIIRILPFSEGPFLTGVEDSKGNLWLTTEDGALVKLDIDKEDFQLFDRGYEFHDRTQLAITPGDTLFLGRMGSLFLLDLNTFQTNQEIPRPYLAGIKIMGAALSKLPGESFQLPHDRNFLEFKLSCIAYNFPEKVRLFCQLKGLEKDYNDLQGRRFISYRGLAPGKYTLLARAENNEGLSSEEMVLLEFRILPPWWRSWWFYLLITSSLAALVYQFYRLRLRQKVALIEAREARESAAFRTRMLGNVTHEFRTPLTVIDGIAEEGQKSWTISPEARGQLETIRRQNKKVLQLVDQLMQLSSMDRQELKAEFQEVEINTLLRSSIDSFRQPVNQKELLLETILPEGRLILNTDPEKLRQIIDNFLSNAVKFTPEGGSIKVEAGPKENKLLISVTDSGIGIPEEDLPRVFERFYQSKAPGRSDYEGTGIGLSIVKEYTDLLGGKIELSSREGEGARFDLWLPGPVVSGTESTNHQPINKENPAQKAPIHEAENGSRPHILIVEDNLALRELLQIQLQQKYRLSFAGDGQRGLEKSRREMPDLILLDWMMPEMNGLELCKQLKSELLTCHIPVIMLTAKVQKEDQLSGLSEGADAYITKPHNKKELQVQIRSLLENRRRLQKKYAGLAILPDQPTHNRDEQLLQELAKLVLENMGKEQFSIDWLASQLHLSRSAFDRKIKALTQRTAALYIRSIRLKKAHHLIRETEEPISSIAYQCGYKNAGHFSQDFKEEFGKSPSGLRNSKKE